MSWIKKLFQKFKGDEDDHTYIDESSFEKEQQAIKPVNKSNNDVNARIAYQYPKGQFRFPLIPDENSELRERRPRSNRIQKENIQKPVEFPTQQKKEQTPIKEKQTKVAPIHRKSVEKPSYSKRPFRPTEIPSPIYGYEKRPKAEEAIEFELDQFIRVNSMEEPLGTKESYVQDMAENIETEKEIINNYSNDVKVLFEEQVGEVEEIEEIEEIEETEEIVEVQGLQQILEVDEQNDYDEKLESEFLDFELEISNVNMNEEENVAQAEDDHSNSLSSFEKESPHQVVNVAMEETAVATETPTAPKRTHLPFNVIMLKEDKRKLEKSRLRESTIVPIEKVQEQINETVDIIEQTPVQNEMEELDQSPVLHETEEYYVFPSLNLLKPPVVVDMNSEWMMERENLLNDTLKNFNVRASVVNVTQGPSVTRFEVQPEPGVKVNKITNLSDDIKLSLAAKDIRMEAPIPGKHTIGIEVPNEKSRPVLISEIVNTPEFSQNPSPLTAVLGLDISGKPIVTDLRKMPHGLIAGATGSGKSVCINTILVSLLYKANPHEVKLLLIDPKMVELAPYNFIPHLVSPVITDVKAATAALKWAVEEMERRYELFAHTGVRDISRFNELAENHNRHSDKLPYIVIVIDELADLMMMSPADVEEAICRIAQKARACGIHLIIATQRPSVDVITGLIKANVPTRIAFSVSSQVDSRTIIDISGAERLLGRGDMLFLENGSSKPVRLQGTFVSDEEIDDVVAHVRREQSPNYLFEQEELLKKSQLVEEEDELFYEACEFVIDQGGASTSSLQRRFKIGYNRAARLIDMMEDQGFISEARGSKPRDVLITESELESLQDTSTIG